MTTRNVMEAKCRDDGGRVVLEYPGISRMSRHLGEAGALVGIHRLEAVRAPAFSLAFGTMARLRSSSFNFALASLFATVAYAPQVQAADASTGRVSNGQTANACEFPSTPLVRMEMSICTGTLIHPEVVLFAAHCNEKVAFLRFGETGDWLEKEQGVDIEPEFCKVNPMYKGVSDAAVDWAFCKLAKPVTDYPIVPIAQGCELDQVTNGSSVMLAGFGDSESENAGTKRYGQTRIGSIGAGTINTSSSAVNGCPGDSGGGMLIQLDDGSWRTIGIASTLSGTCGSGSNTYARITANTIAWVESESGIDVTPCFDDAGQWAPTRECGNHLKGSGAPGGGSWGETLEESCRESEVIEFSATCGEPFEETDKEAPVIEFDSPESDAVFRPDETVKIEFRVEDESELKSVVLRVDGGMDIEFEEEPYTYELKDLEIGEHAIEVIATDIAKNEGSATLEFVVAEEEENDDEDDTTQSEDSSDSDTESDDNSEETDDDSSEEDSSTSDDESKSDSTDDEDESDGDDSKEEDKSDEKSKDSGQKASGKSSGCTVASQSTSPIVWAFALFVGGFLRRRRTSDAL